MYKIEISQCENNSLLIVEFLDKEVEQRVLKNVNAVGADGILSEFLINLGPKGKTWFANLATVVMQSSTRPKICHQVKVITLLKPHKPTDHPHSYRLISLLSASHKVFERLLLACLEPTIDKVLPVEQTGFRKNRNYCDQVLAFIKYVENGFQNKEKSGAEFLGQVFKN